jgi:hypothetical protein
LARKGTHRLKVKWCGRAIDYSSLRTINLVRMQISIYVCRLNFRGNHQEVDDMQPKKELGGVQPHSQCGRALWSHSLSGSSLGRKQDRQRVSQVGLSAILPSRHWHYLIKSCAQSRLGDLLDHVYPLSPCKCADGIHRHLTSTCTG